jgi:hypothetical protein
MDVSPEEKERAIDYLTNELPEETLKKIWEKIKEEGDGCLISYHHGFGTKVRNMLRNGGFSWGAIALDEEWDSLVAEAAKRKNKK